MRRDADTRVLVPGKKYRYLKIRVLSLYGRSDNRRGYTIYIFNYCFRIILAWDEYVIVLSRPVLGDTGWQGIITSYHSVCPAVR